MAKQSAEDRARAKAEKEAVKKAAAEQKAAAKAEKQRLASEEADRKKAAKVQADAGKGHNSGSMNDAERQQLFLRHADHWDRCEQEVRAAIKRREDVEKLAKEDGFTKKMLTAASKMDDPKKDAKLRAELRTLAQIAEWKGKPINFQGNLFSKVEIPVTDQAYAEGGNASATGQPRRVPVQYPPGSESFDGWLAGFDDHQKKLHGSIGRGNGEADAAKPTRSSFAEKNAAMIADGDRITRGEVKAGTPIDRSDFQAGLDRQAERAQQIMKEAGGKPPETASEKLARQQGIGDDE